jgi:hypothetical protein
MAGGRKNRSKPKRENEKKKWKTGEKRIFSLSSLRSGFDDPKRADFQNQNPHNPPKSTPILYARVHPFRYSASEWWQSPATCDTRHNFLVLGWLSFLCSFYPSFRLILLQHQTSTRLVSRELTVSSFKLTETSKQSH